MLWTLCGAASLSKASAECATQSQAGQTDLQGMLLAKPRPVCVGVLLHGFSSRDAATDAKRRQVEGIMLRVLKHFLAVF